MFSKKIAVVILLSPCSGAQEEQQEIDPTTEYDLGTGTGDGLCEPDYASDVYDPYPGPHTGYPLFRIAENPLSWPNETFETYVHNTLIASSSSNIPHIDVTSGHLYAKHLNGSQTWKRGWVQSPVFRMLAKGYHSGGKIRWTDGTQTIRVYFDAVHAHAPHYAGAHLFARYQTENDLYVASLRHDGQVMIKKKHCDTYTTLAVAAFSQGSVEQNHWYELSFSAYGDELVLAVDGHEELTAIDDTFSWGSMGVRLDYTDTYLDDWYLIP